jgi:hypothetical protein
MERYLMKILEDGTFLSAKAEYNAGTRIVASPSTSETIRADKFYDSAVEGLFQVIDNIEAGGVPEGLIELGNAIIERLDPQFHVGVKRFFVSKWLFSVFCLEAMIYPEVPMLLLLRMRCN